MGFCKTELPGQTGVLDPSPTRRASATVVARDQDVVSFGLGDTSCNNADTSFRNKFDGDARAWAGTFEIVDELLEILD